MVSKVKIWKNTRISLSKIEDEYLEDMMTDTDEMYRLKKIIQDLDDTDKALLIMYADLESMAKTGKVFSVSPATIYGHIKRIREDIKKKMSV